MLLKLCCAMVKKVIDHEVSVCLLRIPLPGHRLEALDHLATAITLGRHNMEVMKLPLPHTRGLYDLYRAVGGTYHEANPVSPEQPGQTAACEIHSSGHIIQMPRID